MVVVGTTLVGCNSAEHKKAIENRKIEKLLSQMTLEEKIGMLHANRMFSSGGVARLGIPDVWFSDGPHGVRYESVDNGWASLNWDNDACTNMPALSALAATWNKELALQCGEVIGAESKARGKHVQLAPGVNITRSVLSGRTWEYFSEDPYITAELAVPYIKGVQSQGVAACVKHLALNSQALSQYWISSQTDRRTLREIYLPAFEAAVKRGGVMALMPAYNKVDGLWCSENKYLIDTLLRNEWGFDGLVVSDWNGVHNTVSTATTGIDVEMGTAIK
ncbi:MAG: glycoside hydrolase family 3 protein, partial [Tidjanibacter sp.]|nr:glycoside hydrolase family 3 protein [Tidjanibacter sp.]